MNKDKSEYKDLVRHSDVTFWGAGAIIVGALAILGANLPALLPSQFITGLHSTRLEGGNLNYLRSQVAQLQAETVLMRNEYARIASQITLAEQRRNKVTQRVGALEDTIPAILQAVPPGARIDSSISTASIGNNNSEIIEAEGGSVSVSIKPLESNVSNELDHDFTQVEMPPKLDEEPKIEKISTSQFGVAIGPEVTIADSYIAWREYEAKVGTLLLGLEPILSDKKDGNGQRIIAGPIRSYAQAEQLCTRLIRVGIECLPLPYSGQKIEQ